MYRHNNYILVQKMYTFFSLCFMQYVIMKVKIKEKNELFYLVMYEVLM